MGESRRFSDEVVNLLRLAGWYEGRASGLDVISLPWDFEIFPVAESVLREFGGLKIGSVGTGLNTARSDVEILPDSGAGMAESFPYISGLPDGRLYPIGMFHHKHCIMFILETGEMYYYFDEMFWLDQSFDSALSNLLLGIKSVKNQ